MTVINPTRLILNQIQQFATAPQPTYEQLTIPQFIALADGKFTPDCPLKIRPTLDDEVLNSMSFFRLCETLLQIIQREQSIKLTTTGALPRKIITELYQHKFIIEPFIEEGISKLNRERDVISIENAKIICSMAGLTKKRTGKLTLTKNGENLLNNRYQLFLAIFNTYTTDFNWGYNDGYENEFVPRFAWMYVFYLLLKYGSTECPTQFYAEKYLAIAGNLRSDFLVGFTDTFNQIPPNFASCFQIRMFRRFTDWFGFTLTPDKPFPEPKTTRTTPNFEQIFAWEPEY